MIDIRYGYPKYQDQDCQDREKRKEKHLDLKSATLCPETVNQVRKPEAVACTYEKNQCD